jgi:hypothetical protein
VPPPRRIVLVVVSLLVLAVAAVAGGFALWDHLRTSRADALAVKHGAAPSTGEATLADRCMGVIHEEYDRSDDPRKAGIPPRTFARLAPQICALGVRRGLVQDDGTMTEEAGEDLASAVIERMGVTRFQTLVFDELAVTEYRLAKEGEVTPWDRCVAMGYGGWDAQPSKANLPERQAYRLAIREACTLAVERGIMPAQGFPAADSPEGVALQQLLIETVLEVSAR